MTDVKCEGACGMMTDNEARKTKALTRRIKKLTVRLQQLRPGDDQEVFRNIADELATVKFMMRSWLDSMAGLVDVND